MCGRFTQAMSWRKLHSLYQMPRQTTLWNLRARYNGCPTQDFSVYRRDEGGAGTIGPLRWGLVPSWAEDPRRRARYINARAETVHKLPAFRAAFRRRRCLVPADGWFEWCAGKAGKQPYFISAAAGEPLSFAGLWERWEGPEEPLETFTLVTTAASAALADIHDRQPSVIRPEDFDEWLAHDTSQERRLELVRRPWEGPYHQWRVSKRVNSSRNEGPDLVQPLDE